MVAWLQAISRVGVVVFACVASARLTLAQPECGPTWRDLVTPAPTPRDLAGFVYDTTLGVGVLYSGRPAQGGALNDLWTWNGTAWSNLSATGGPVDRQSFASAYDQARGELLVFGGFRPFVGGAFQELWAWNSTTQVWTLRLVGGPSARQGAVMAYDPIRSVVMLFGGFAGGYLNDLWEWDGTTWTYRGQAGPSGRDDASLTFDPVRNRLVLFGGFTSSGALGNDTWEWTFNTSTNTGSWQARTFAGATPPPRYAGSLIFDAGLQRVVLYGGSGTGTTVYADCWNLGGGEWVQEVGLTPSGRWGSGMIYDAARGRRVLFGGGLSGEKLDDTWEYQGSRWNPVAGTRTPSARYGAVMEYDVLRERVVLAGGWNGSAFLDDTWIRHKGAWGRVAGTSFPARADAAAAYDSDMGKIVMFGGRESGNNASTQTWEFGDSGWVQRFIGSPPGRRSAKLAFDSTRDQLVLHGGMSAADVELGDTWELGPTGWVQNLTPGPTGPRRDFTMEFDPLVQRTILHGGYRVNPHFVYSDTWDYDGVLWRLRPAAGGPQLDSAGMAFDARRGTMVLVAGSPDYDGAADARESLSGTPWELVVPVDSPIPSPRLNPMVCFDGSTGTTLMVGGLRNGAALDERWDYVGPGNIYPRRGLPPAEIYVCVPVNAQTISSDAAGFGALTYQWLRNGFPINTIINPSAATNVLNIPGGNESDVEGLYQCVVNNECDSYVSPVCRVLVCVADVDDGTATGTCDFGVTIDDLLFYLFLFESGNLRADVDDGSGTSSPDGGVTIDDLLYYFRRFEEGC